MLQELKVAQATLIESEIKRFWTAMTRYFPHMCVNDGVHIDYEKPILMRHVHDIVGKLMKCDSNLHVATLFFQYNYEPKNDTPHHATAITLTKDRDRTYLTLFNPKGRSSKRKKHEEFLLKKMAHVIQTHYRKNIPIEINIYNGKNLQLNDNIGLCQLYSLRYLLEYVVRAQNFVPSTTKDLKKITIPHEIITFIEQKDGDFSEPALYNFWKKYFPNFGHKKKLIKK